MAIEFENIIIESVILAVIIFGAVYLELWYYRRYQKIEDEKTKKMILRLIKEDLTRKQRFLEESIKFKDYKPFFTNVWDSIILSGKQTLLSFELINNFEHSYSWMRYYNTELHQRGVVGNEQTLLELLGEIKKTIESSLNVLKSS
ncbi:MAG: hypothetical protein XU09_C0008G0221 [Thaumarchaeota archaeon CSP1-1]|nr:MAG: hypothetical protein XU09_C0008G0221 [Thaumarchaeota archaeon CSP1-1]